MKSRALQVPIGEGSISKTEITATRTVQNQTEKLNFKTQVLVASDKEPVFQALDLAHELVHAVNPKHNPFDPALSASAYVQSGIESEGGEANAIAQECKVGKEMIETSHLREEAIQMIKARCQFAWKTEASPSRWTESFYFMGQYYRDFLRQIRGTRRAHEDPKAESNWDVKVANRSPVFSSAVAHKPYPLALLEEYLEITKTICARAKTSALARKIASASQSLEERCQAVVRSNP